MRTLGTRLPSTQTVHENMWGGLNRGRPVVIPPKTVKLGVNKREKVGYHLLWEKVKPEAIRRADEAMNTYMPPGLAPQALSYVNARKRH
jgi:hypothetical protein